MAKRLTSMVLAAACLTWCAVAVAQPPAQLPGGMPFPPLAGPPPVDFVPAEAPVGGLLGPVFSPPETGSTEPIVHFGYEFLMWSVSRQRANPLVTSGSAFDPVPGALGQPNTTVLLNRFDQDHMHQGGRLSMGVGLDSRSDWAIQGTGFWLDERQFQYRFKANGESGGIVLARPFYNVVSKMQDADPAAFPLIASGAIDIKGYRRVDGFDVDLRYLYLEGTDSRLVFLAGGAYFALQEGVTIRMTSQDLPGIGAPGNLYHLSEDFTTRNTFYGAQFGADYEFHVGPVFLKSVAKLGVGNVTQTVNRNPFISITETTGIVTSSSDRALYISPANAGKSSRSCFAVMPEASFKVGIDLNRYVQVSVGYSVLYLNNVLRSTEQIDRNVIVQPVGTTDTFGSRGHAPTFRQNDFTAQGLDAMLRLSF